MCKWLWNIEIFFGFLPVPCVSLSDTKPSRGWDQEGRCILQTIKTEAKYSSDVKEELRIFQPDACWIKVEFLLSSVRKCLEPWPHRWTKIFSTWTAKTRIESFQKSVSKWEQKANIGISSISSKSFSLLRLSRYTALDRRRICIYELHTKKPIHLEFDMTGFDLKPLQQVLQQTLITRQGLVRDFCKARWVKGSIRCASLLNLTFLQQTWNAKDTSDFLEKVARTGALVIRCRLH